MIYSRIMYLTSPLAALLFAAPVSADEGECEASLSSVSGASINGYDALANGDFITPMQIVLRNSGDEACNGVIAFRARRSEDRLSGPSGFTFNYVIVGESNANEVVYDPIADRGVGIAVTVRAGGSLTLRPQLRVDGGQVGISGRYEASIDVIFTQQSDGLGAADFAPMPEAIVFLSANAVPSVQANFSGLDGGNPSIATLALGELRSGLERNIGLQLRANTDVDVTVTSANGGMLTRGGAGAEQNNNIAYRMTIGNTALNLRQMQQIELHLGPDTVRRTTRLVKVTVGDTSRSRAGNYSDTIVFRVSAR